MNWSPIIAFVAGAIYDAVNIGFMHASEKNQYWRAGIFSVLVGACALTGFLEAGKNAEMIPYLFAGYFVGTVATVWAKGRKKKVSNPVSKIGPTPSPPEGSVEVEPGLYIFPSVRSVFYDLVRTHKYPTVTVVNCNRPDDRCKTCIFCYNLDIQRNA